MPKKNNTLSEEDKEELTSRMDHIRENFMKPEAFEIASKNMHSKQNAQIAHKGIKDFLFSVEADITLSIGERNLKTAWKTLDYGNAVESKQDFENFVTQHKALEKYQGVRDSNDNLLSPFLSKREKEKAIEDFATNIKDCILKRRDEGNYNILSSSELLECANGTKITNVFDLQKDTTLVHKINRVYDNEVFKNLPTASFATKIKDSLKVLFHTIVHDGTEASRRQTERENKRRVIALESKVKPELDKIKKELLMTGDQDQNKSTNFIAKNFVNHKKEHSKG